MATLVSFHAHPDDETITCGGVMRKASEEGHRVVLVIATRGEHGEVPDGFLGDGESLRDRRVQETEAAAKVLGAARVEFLGYVDSGMMGTPENDAPGSFWTAPVDEAAGRLAEILREEDAEILTCYDSHGTYGHPDHIQVHRVGMRAAELAGTPRVFQATGNRDRMLAGMRDFAARNGHELPPEEEFAGHGTPESEIDVAVDVTPWLEYKREAMRAHASQISADSFFLGSGEDTFRTAFGHEWFLRPGHGPASDLFT